MCDDHGDAEHPSLSAAPDLSRRRVLQGMVALAAFSRFGTTRRASAASLAARAPSLTGVPARILAMHLHASASEGPGSMRAQLGQAAANGFDVAWFTEHDWRRRRLLFRSDYRFLAKDVVYGGTWNLVKLANVGALTTTSGALLVTSPVSPNDPGGGSLRMRATSTGTAQGTAKQRLNAEGSSRANYAARIAGRTVSIDVLLTKSGADAWAEMSFTLSRQLAAVGRTAGQISMLYRFRTDITTRRVSTQDRTGIVDVPLLPGTWQTVTIDLPTDVGAAWADLEPRDNALLSIEFHATSRRKAAAEVYFGRLHFAEVAGYDGVGVEHDLAAHFASTVNVLGLIGTELSFGPHINQFGGAQNPYDYGPVTRLGGPTGEIRPSVVSFIHAQGGLASINHPFKPGDSSPSATPQKVATDLLSIGAGGADLLEVGYANKFGGDINAHLAVWDTLSRNALFLTGNGVSDDHTGTGWAGQPNRYYTAAWSGTLDEPSLMSALAAGSSYVGYLGSFAGTIDMVMDGVVPMGAVAVSPSTSRSLHVGVSGVPTGGAVQVLRGVVDPRGTADPNPNTQVTATLTPSAGSVAADVPVDTGNDCFVRLQVVNSAGGVVGFGQPIWVFKSAPAGAPAARLVTA